MSTPVPPQAPAPDSTPVAPRDPGTVMRLAFMGHAFPTRLSVMRALVRQMSRERWRLERRRFDLDASGFGTAVYTITTPARHYSLVVFSHQLAPEQRTDRVIAEAWDATFTLFDGIPGEQDIARLADHTPRQEAGRYRQTELVLSRANRSVRLFEHVTASLAAGRQPEVTALRDVGYLMRTTAVYGNGKFGMADRTRYAARAELAGPFRAELLTVYLIRSFTFDLVDHVAAHRSPASAVTLDPALRRFLGIGNATGLGMAPFLVSHPRLIHKWFAARERALARVRSLESVEPARHERFLALLERARAHVAEWRVDDAGQSARIDALARELTMLSARAREKDFHAAVRPWDALYRDAEQRLSTETVELLVALLLEPWPELVDPLAEDLSVDDEPVFDPGMSVSAMRELVECDYRWALEIDFRGGDADRHFWYYSAEKLEPRRGERASEPGADREMPLAVARDVQAFLRALRGCAGSDSLARFLARHPQHRATARRVQELAGHAYAEIRDNLIGAGCRPVDILRAKLAFFGAVKFDPRSELWTRITMYQGAPLPGELQTPDADDWSFPVAPPVPPCTSR